MKKLTFLFTICFFVLAAAPTAVAQEYINVDADVETIVQDWPKVSAKIAMKMTNKYGPPEERTASRLIWYENGPWNISIVRRNPFNHDFPVPHKDVLYQNIEYDVPIEYFDELAWFDGSLIIEQTRGTLGVRCHAEAPNFIAINLAYEIVTGQITPAAARQKYGRLIVKMKKGIPSPYYKRFIFDLPEGPTAHSGEPVVPKDIRQEWKMSMNMNGDMMKKDSHMSMTDEENSGNDYSGSATKVGANRSDMYGWYLVDASGRTLYMFKADNRYESSDCYGQCADVWPPMLVKGSTLAASSMINENMIGTIERRDGSMQVTYNGWPLYYYVEDQSEGKFTGQDVKGFGAEWYMMEPNGTILHGENAKMNMEMNMNMDQEDDY